MPTAAKSDLVLISISSLKDGPIKPTEIVYGELYQQIATGLAGSFLKNKNMSEVGEALVALADNAYGRRQIDVVAHLGHLLESLPLPTQYRRAGSYYLALHLKRQGRTDRARALLDSIVESPSSRFRPRALQSLAAIALEGSDPESSRTLRLEAIRAGLSNDSSDVATVVHAQRMLAVHKGLEGYHQRALEDLERLSAVVHSISRWHPQVYYDYLNSLAVEYAAVGRIEEAHNASRIVMASSYASAYPEWRETLDDIEEKIRPASRPFVATSYEALDEAKTSCEATNVVHLSSFQRAEDPSSRGFVTRNAEPARILDFQRWSQKRAMIATANNKFKRLTPEQLNALTVNQKRARLVKLIYQFRPSDKTLEQILARVEAILFDWQSPA